MNIGLFFKHKPWGGGIYQYFLSLLNGLSENLNRNRVLVFGCLDRESSGRFLPKGVRLIHLEKGAGTGRSVEIRHRGHRIVFKQPSLSSALRQAALENRIDLMIYPTLELEAVEADIPFAMAIHDVAHRILPQFEEFTGNGIREQREYLCETGLHKALCVMADSKTGKRQILANYPGDPGKIEVLPFVAPAYLNRDAPAQQSLGNAGPFPHEPYLFYPAHFWPHKNHANLLRALHLLKETQRRVIPAVFVGSRRRDWNGFDRVLRLSRELGVADQVHYLGFVHNTDMRTLYSGARALVMPTFLGPTNQPILEAFVTGCPVIASNIEGCHEQIGDAGLLFDPYDPPDMADAILRIWENETLRNDLVLRGRARAARWTPQDFGCRLAEIVDRCGRQIRSQANGSALSAGSAGPAQTSSKDPRGCIFPCRHTGREWSAER